MSASKAAEHLIPMRFKQADFTLRYFLRGDDAPDTVMFLGTAQIGRIPYWIAETLPPGVAVVEGMPHWLLHPSAEDLREFAEYCTQATFRHLLQEFQVSKLNAIAISQAAPGLVWYAAKQPHNVDNIGLFSPLGFTREALGADGAARLTNLKKRAFRSILQQAPDMRNIYASLVLLKTRLAEKERGASDRKFTAGLDTDLTDELRLLKAAKQHHIHIFTGNWDVVFPFHELTAAFKKADIDIDVVELPGISHGSFVTRRERAALHEVVEAIRT